MGMAVGSGEGGYVADINVTPMVDVMLVLLIIFMVIAPMLQSGVSVALPKSKNPEKDDNIVKDTSAVIAIPNDNEIWLNRDPLPNDKTALAEELTKKLEAKFANKQEEEKVVYIKSGALVKYGKVVDVIDAIRNAGYTTIGLVSEKEKMEGGGGGQ
jgi:biopolymer transport protein ExbD/biopolymer transport protein TolR